MAKVFRLCLVITTALALCKYSLAEWNVTGESANGTVTDCHQHGDRNNCTANTKDEDEWSGHLSKCPEEFSNFCIHGECRYVTEQKTVSCRCTHGYHGSRCEYVDIDWRIGEKRHIIVVGVIGGLVLLIAVIVFICVVSHRRCRLPWRRRRRREEPRNGTEKLSMMDKSAAHINTDSTELAQTEAV